MIMAVLSPSQNNVLELLSSEGEMTLKDLVSKSSSSPRTIRYALKKLKEKNLLIEKINMRDMRQIIYLNRLNPGEDSGLAKSSAASQGNLVIYGRFVASQQPGYSMNRPAAFTISPQLAQRRG